MERLEDFAQSYSQAPWRKQLQLIGLFSLVLVVIALVASIYLNVSARAAEVGRNIQDMQREIDDLQLEIEDLQSQLAYLKSSQVMDDRINDLGFRTVQSDQIVYISIPGYTEQPILSMAPNQVSSLTTAPVLPAEYTESLFAWLERKMAAVSIALIEVQP